MSEFLSFIIVKYVTILKIIKLFAFLLISGIGISTASAVNSDIGISDPNLVSTNGEQDKIKSKSSQDKYSFTLFNFFYTESKSTSDSSSTVSKEMNEVVPTAAPKIVL